MMASSSSSFLDLDESILRQVKSAITRVAEIEQGLDSSIDESDDATVPVSAPGTASSEEILEQQRRELEEQVATLESEIESLEAKLAMGEDAHGESVEDANLQSAILELAGGATGDKPLDEMSKDDLFAQLLKAGGEESVKKLRLFRSKIKLNESFSGIKFKSVDWEIKEKDDTGLLREYTHVGSTIGYDFRVVFAVREERSEACKSDDPQDIARIVMLVPKVDSRAERDMNTFLSRVSEDCNLMSFYQTYFNYCIFHRERVQCFGKAKAKFGEWVHCSEGIGGTRLKLSVPGGLSLNFTWTLAVSAEGDVDQALSVQIKTASNVSSEVLEVVTPIPQHLQKMILAYGHKEAFLNLLALFEPES